MQQVPEPDREEWVRRLRERARLDAAELVPSVPFDVFGLGAPRLRPAALAQAGQVNGVWETITLAYGDWADPAGPFIAVTSEAGRPGRPAPDAEMELVREIGRERSRIAGHAGVDEEDPPEPPRYQLGGFRVGDGRVNGLVCRHGTVWAGRMPVGGVMVTVTGRGVDPDVVELGPVADLGPYLRGRNQMLGQLAEQFRRRPPPALEPAEGVAAYHALAEAALESQARTIQAHREGREARHRAGEGPAMGALWQRAVREQARISGVDDRRADRVVTQVINHLTHLHERAAWFTADPRLRAAAIDETLRHAVLGESVPSDPAQQAWVRYWEHHASLAAYEPGPALPAGLAAGQPLISAWLAAWSAWTRQG